MLEGPNIYPLLRSILFRQDPEDAHHTAMNVLTWVGETSFAYRRVHAWWGSGAHRHGDKLASRHWGLLFPGPVGLAAGFDKDGIALRGLAALGFHFVELGTVTPRPQPGNPRPRLFRLPQDRALVNRMGFNNMGVDHLRERLERWAEPSKREPSSSLPSVPMPVGVNIGKNKDTPIERTIDDYIACLRSLYPLGDYYAINLSSPNTPGLRDLQKGSFVSDLLTAVRQALDELFVRPAEAWSGSTKDAYPNPALGPAPVGNAPPSSPKPLLLKIAPDLSEPDLERVLDAALAARLSGLIVANTWPHPNGGLSGRPLKERADRLVASVYRRVGTDLTLIGVGGIFNAEDAYARIKAGASLTQLYTGFIYEGPGLMRSITQGLVELLARDGFRHIDDAVGVEADRHPEPWANGGAEPAPRLLTPIPSAR